jgi:hypothetical protein
MHASDQDRSPAYYSPPADDSCAKTAPNEYSTQFKGMQSGRGSTPQGQRDLEDIPASAAAPQVQP